MRLAVGRGPDARILARAGQVVAAERLEERRVGRDDDVAHDVAHAFAIGLVATWTIDGTIADSIGHREHPLDLGDRPLGHDARRGQAARESLAQDLGVGGHERRVGVETGDERLEALRRVGRLELGQLGQELLRTAHLVDDPQLVEALVVLLDLQVGDDLEHVERDPVLGRQAIGRHRRRLGRGPLHQAPHRGASGRARVIETVGVALVAVERRGDRIELEERLPEAFGEGVDGRWLEVRHGHAWVSCVQRGRRGAVREVRRG